MFSVGTKDQFIIFASGQVPCTFSFGPVPVRVIVFCRIKEAPILRTPNVFSLSTLDKFQASSVHYATFLSWASTVRERVVINKLQVAV